jgi:hypothetical protein
MPQNKTEVTNKMWSKSIRLKNNKRIIVQLGDICTTDASIDLLICSAFKGDYFNADGTLIGSLNKEKSISVEKLSQNPELDYREDNNCWVSRKIASNIQRIACVELLDYEQKDDIQMQQSVILKDMFSSVYYLLAEMNKNSLKLERVVLPILGSGNQGIEICYIIPPLISQCIRALEEIPQLREIVFYELDEGKAWKLYDGLIKALDKDKLQDDVFISYSSAQRKQADEMKNYLEEHGISCWMAPYSIPSGSSYQAEIPAALNNTSAVVLLLSEDSEKSRWVQKEVGSTIGARQYLIPYMDHEYEHTQQFNFLLDGEQIFEAWTIKDESKRYQVFLDEICQKLKKNHINSSSQIKTENINIVNSPKDKETITDELKNINKTLKIGFAGIIALKSLELIINISNHKK